MEGRVALLDIGRLSMDREVVARADETRWRVGRRARRIVEAIVEAEAKLVEREAGADALAGRRKVHGQVRKIGPEIFAADRPVRCDRRLDADAGRPAEAVKEAV